MQFQVTRKLVLYLGSNWPERHGKPAEPKWGLVSLVCTDGRYEDWVVHLLPHFRNWFDFEWASSGYACVRVYSLGILGCYIR